MEVSTAYFESLGYNLGIDTPYSGTIVPPNHFRTEKRVLGIMLEVNRRLYLDEHLCRNQNFDT
jgi:N-formylglutamate amidohydrolase